MGEVQGFFVVKYRLGAANTGKKNNSIIIFTLKKSITFISKHMAGNKYLDFEGKYLYTSFFSLHFLYLLHH